MELCPPQPKSTVNPCGAAILACDPMLELVGGKGGGCGGLPAARC